MQAGHWIRDAARGRERPEPAVGIHELVQFGPFAPISWEVEPRAGPGARRGEWANQPQGWGAKLEGPTPPRRKGSQLHDKERA